MGRKMLLLFILSTIALNGCNQVTDVPSHSKTILEWVDFLNINGNKYMRLGEGVLKDPSLVGEEVGKVKFKVADNISNPNYRTKEGDAAFLEKGTEVYEVKGIEDMVVVKDESNINGYKLYYKYEDKKFNWNYSGVNQSKIKKIELYNVPINEGGIMEKEVLINTISNSTDIKEFFTILDQGTINDNIGYSGEPDEHIFFMVLYSDSPIANKYSVFYADNQYIWPPDHMEVIPIEIEKYFKR